MKIIMKSRYCDGTLTIEPGGTGEVPDKQARDLIAKGYALPADEDPSAGGARGRKTAAAVRSGRKTTGGGQDTGEDPAGGQDTDPAGGQGTGEDPAGAGGDGGGQ